MARDQNTFAKRRREMEKKRKAEEKRERRRKKKEQPDDPTGLDIDREPIDGPQRAELLGEPLHVYGRTHRLRPGRAVGELSDLIGLRAFIISSKARSAPPGRGPLRV